MILTFIAELMINRIWGTRMSDELILRNSGMMAVVEEAGRGWNIFPSSFLIVVVTTLVGHDCTVPYCTNVPGCRNYSMSFHSPLLLKLNFFAISAKSCEIQHLMQENPWSHTFCCRNRPYVPIPCVCERRLGRDSLSLQPGFTFFSERLQAHLQSEKGWGVQILPWEKLTSNPWRIHVCYIW